MLEDIKVFWEAFHAGTDLKDAQVCVCFDAVPVYELLRLLIFETKGDTCYTPCYIDHLLPRWSR